MTKLHPVKWSIERTGNGFYAFGFGGGLAESVVGKTCQTQAEALKSLKFILSKFNRCPDVDLIYGETDEALQLKAILS